MEKLDISSALLTLEEKGLIDYDEEDDTFEATELGAKIVNGVPIWLIELHKITSYDTRIVCEWRSN
jgi:hypothetical protein